MTVLAPGTPVPDFSLSRHDGSAFTRADLAGRATVLAFYPFAFSPVCTDQLSVYQEVLADIAAQGGALYGVSCDATPSQTAFRQSLGIEIEQLSDFEPKGRTCAAFGVLHPDGFPQRALVVIGTGGERVAYSYEAPTLREVPGANLIFDGLAAAGAG